MKNSKSVRFFFVLLCFYSLNINAQSFIKELSKNSSSHIYTTLNGEMYLSTADTIHGTELWKSDGTEEGTVMIKDIAFGLDEQGKPKSSHPQQLTIVNNEIFFMAFDISHTSRNLWKSDGTEEGTVMISKTNFSSFGSLKSLNNKLYFVGNDGTSGNELWVSDGTEEGTVMIKDINTTFTTASSIDVIGGVLNDKLYFAAQNNEKTGNELWVSDGTEEGTVMLKDINTQDERSSMGTSYSDRIRTFTFFKEELYFAAFSNNGTGEELWKTDGTEEGTVMVKDINEGYSSSDPVPLKVINEIMYFRAEDDIYGPALWKTDGTEEGTVMVKDINTKSIYSGASLDGFIEFNDIIYFTANDQINGEQVWKTDGTEEGTVMVTNFESFYPDAPFIEFNNKLYFRAYTSETGSELWETDGTEEGTKMVKDIDFGTNSFSPSSLTILNNDLFFIGNIGIHASNSTYTYEMWKLSSDEVITSFQNVSFTNRTIVKAYNLQGIEISPNTKNQLIILIYNDGTTEKVIYK